MPRPPRRDLFPGHGCAANGHPRCSNIRNTPPPHVPPPKKNPNGATCDRLSCLHSSIYSSPPYGYKPTAVLNASRPADNLAVLFSFELIGQNSPSHACASFVKRSVKRLAHYTSTSITIDKEHNRGLAKYYEEPDCDPGRIVLCDIEETRVAIPCRFTRATTGGIKEIIEALE